jgi:hypothetical protein
MLVAVVMPNSKVGVLWTEKPLPTPSSPSLFLPQHITLLSVSITHERNAPRATLVAQPNTSTGVLWTDKPLPTPSSPSLFLPQHITLLSVSIAHERNAPRAMLVAVVMPETSTGVVLSVVLASPSWP